jgi:hypothetical protein
MSEEIEYTQLTDDMVPEQWTALIYGQSGVQKTRLAAQWPDPLFLSCERGKYGGLISAKEFHPKQIKITTYEQYVSLISRLRKDAEVGKYKTLVLDSMTAFQETIMRQILDSAGKEIPRYEDWNLLSARVRKVINTLANFHSHFVMIATEQITKDEITGKVIGAPNVPGKLAMALPPAVDLCLHMGQRSKWNEQGKKETLTFIQTAGDDLWQAKDCSGTLPPEIIIKQGESVFAPLSHLFKEEK